MSPRSNRRWPSGVVSAVTAAVLAATFIATPPLAFAQTEPVITFNFREVELTAVVEAVAAVTGRTIIVDPTVRQGTITVVSTTPLGPDAAWETFLAVLQVHNLVVVQSGNAYKIIQEQSFRTVPGAESGSGTVAPDDVITRVIPLQFIPAGQVVPPLRPLASQYGHLAAYPASNMIIISDRAANVERLVEILRRIDQQGEQEVEVIRLSHATATEIVRMMTALQQAQAGETGSAGPSLVADERTNSILISGGLDQRLRLRTLIAHLDTPLDQDANTQVVYLDYANAETLSETLRSFVGTQAGGTDGGATSSSLSTTILSDADTNALIITAPPAQMRSIRSVVERLDIRRAQVLVEAILVEVTSDRSAEFGITWALQNEGNGYGGVTNFAGSGTGIVQLGQAAAVDTPTTIPVGDGVTFGLGRIDNGGVSFGGILRALEGDGTTNILSTPYQVTLDNEEAVFQVGQEVPFLTGQFTNTGGTGGAVNPFQTIDRQEVGTKLTITPQINEGTAVRLAINLEVSSISTGSEGAVDLITNKRTLTTNVIVDDGAILVLGGLIDDAVQENEQRVPILGSIPFLGRLFRYTTSSSVKRNLLVFIRPVIIRDGEHASMETDARYRYLRDEMIRLNPNTAIPLLPDEVRPSLPDFALPASADDDQDEEAAESDDG
jgi:general secretion pathway protein D